MLVPLSPQSGCGTHRASKCPDRLLTVTSESTIWGCDQAGQLPALYGGMHARRAAKLHGTGAAPTSSTSFRASNTVSFPEALAEDRRERASAFAVLIRCA